MDLLEKASIILTPTAYNNGEALCVKPSDGSGDFDFSRNSAATRVNAQGLVENVQILSSNLVQNGDFSEEGAEEVSNGSFSQEGSELITNGDFSSDTAWGKEVGWSISDGSLVANSVTTGLAFQSNIVEANKFYKATYDVVVTSGSIGLYFDGGTGYQGIATTTQTVTVFFKATTASPLYFRSDTSNFTGSIDNVSVREVGQDWSLGTGWSIGEDKAISDGTSSNLDQFNTFTSGTTYKVVYTIEDYISGDIRFRFTGASNENGTLRNSNGTYTEYIKLTNTQSVFRFIGSGVLSITNISVKEVGQNWDLGTGWSIGNNIAISDATQGYIIQTDVGGAGVTATYKIQWTQNITAGTRLRFFARNYNDGGGETTLSITRDDGLNIGGGNCVGSGTFTAYVSSTNGYSFKLLAEAGVEADITNITTIQITDDTNLPRINYEGFSYQDALGSEEVLNGGFDTDLSGWTYSNDVIWNNGKAQVNALDGAFKYIEQQITSTGTVTYKISFDVSNIQGVLQVIFANNLVTEQSTNGSFEVYYTTSETNPRVQFKRKVGTNTFFEIDNVSVKEVTGQSVVPESGCGSWLFEPQSTNTINNSNSDFLAFNMDLVYNDVKSPDGTQNAFKATTTTTGGSQFRPYQEIITPSTFSIFLKYGNNQWYQVINSSATGFYANIDVQNGVFGTSGADTDNLSVKDYGNGWFRFSGTFTSASTTGSIRVYASSSSSAGWAGVSAPIGSYVYGYGFQVEALDYATSYIPTEGTQKTRNQDLCTNGGSLASINSTEGVLYAEIAKRQDNNDSYILISLNNQASNSDNNSVTIGFSNSTGFFLRIRASGNSYLLFQGSSVLANKNQFYKVALKYKSGNSSVFIDGVNVLNSTDIFSFNQSLDNLSFDFNGNGGYPFYGKTKAVAVWKEALSDSELQSLTTI